MKNLFLMTLLTSTLLTISLPSYSIVVGGGIQDAIRAKTSKRAMSALIGTVIAGGVVTILFQVQNEVSTGNFGFGSIILLDVQSDSNIISASLVEALKVNGVDPTTIETDSLLIEGMIVDSGKQIVFLDAQQIDNSNLSLSAKVFMLGLISQK